MSRGSPWALTFPTRSMNSSAGSSRSDASGTSTSLSTPVAKASFPSTERFSSLASSQSCIDFSGKSQWRTIKSVKSSTRVSAANITPNCSSCKSSSKSPEAPTYFERLDLTRRSSLSGVSRSDDQATKVCMDQTR